MNHCECPKSIVPVSLCKCHVHRVGIETQTKHSSLIQEPPHNSATSLVSHQPLDVLLFIFLCQLVSKLTLVASFLLANDVERVIVAHREI